MRNCVNVCYIICRSLCPFTLEEKRRRFSVPMSETLTCKHSVWPQLLTCSVPGNTWNLANEALGVRSTSTRLIFNKSHTSTGEKGAGEESERCGTFRRFHTRVSRRQNYEWIQWGWLANACRCIHTFTHSDISYHREVNQRIWPREVRNATWHIIYKHISTHNMQKYMDIKWISNQLHVWICKILVQLHSNILNNLATAQQHRRRKISAL